MRQRERRGGLSDAEVAELHRRASMAGGFDGADARVRSMILLAHRAMGVPRSTSEIGP